MPEHVDPKTGRRLYHENETTLEVEKRILAKFAKEGDAGGSYMHRTAAGPDAVDAVRAADAKGAPVVKPKDRLSLYDVEYKLDGMNVVPVNKNTGERLDGKQVEALNKQLAALWMLKE